MKGEAGLAMSERVSLVGPNAPQWEGGGSRPSKTNCTSGELDPEADDAETREIWWQRKNEIVNRFLEEMPQRAARPISVRGGTKLRDEAAREKYDGKGRYRSRTWSAVLNEFLKWYNDYRGAELVFQSPEGEEVRGEMVNSHMPSYGDKYYARLKAFERQVVKEFDEPHSVMLTFSGSSRNANGGWRCPADHLRDIIESGRPDRGRGVYHTLRSVLKGRRWEYALVVEKHQSGCGHVHCAVFVDGEVAESEFQSVIDAHLRQCEIAGWEAHDYHSPNEYDRPISVKRIDPNSDDGESIANLGSYIGEYIGAYGEALFDRSLDELIFRAATWATGTQIVRFSNGANEMINLDRGGQIEEEPEEQVSPNPEFDLERHGNPDSEVYPFKVENPGWSIIGVARCDGAKEGVFELHRSNVVWREIDDASKLDPAKLMPPVRPRKRSKPPKISKFSNDAEGDDFNYIRQDGSD